MAETKDWDEDSLISAVEDDALITIAFPDSDKTSTLPRSILFNASIWFRKALAPGRFSEGERKTIKLSEGNPVMFRHFVFWLYNKYLPEPDTVDTDPSGRDAYSMVLVQLWVFGDAYFLRKLQNEAMRKLYTIRSGHWLNIDAVKEAFGRTPNTKLSEFLLGELLANMRRSVDEELNRSYSVNDFEALGMMQGFNKALYGRLTSAGGTHFLSPGPASGKAENGGIEEFLVKENA